MKSTASPIIITDNNGNNISITVTPNTTPRAFGAQITVSVAYSPNKKIVLPNPFLGVHFPASISSTKTAMSE